MSSIPKKAITLTVNGDTHELQVSPRERLIDVLREKLYLTGTKEGCSTGDCGACTVIMNGKTVTSCLVLAVSANGSNVTTIEGIGSPSKLHPVQKAFIKHGAAQCGFCTPGMIVSAAAFLKENPRPTEAEIRAGLAGNLCRCTGYTKIIDAVQEAAQEMAAAAQA